MLPCTVVGVALVWIERVSVSKACETLEIVTGTAVSPEDGAEATDAAGLKVVG